jgi:hypothetical protein
MAVKSFMSEKKDRKLLALGSHCGVLLATEDTLVNLGREILGNLQRNCRQELVRLGKLLVHDANQGRLPALQENERQAGSCREAEVKEQVLEGKHVRRDRLADGNLLDSPNIADLPVPFWTVRVRVMTRHADWSHGDGRGHSDVSKFCDGTPARRYPDRGVHGP